MPAPKPPAVKPRSLKGQWVGRYQGTNVGALVLDLDEQRTSFDGSACIFDDNLILPSFHVRVSVPKGVTSHSETLELMAIDRRTANFVLPADYQKVFPGVLMPATADTKIQVKARSLAISWTTNIGTNGSVSLTQGNPESPSAIRPERGVNTWEKFKRYVNSIEVDRYIYRGQTEPWRLRTTFHRTNRSDIARFVAQDVQALQSRLAAILEHVFDSNRFGELGALYSIAQHHGYPTPLLDWTRSPFIAAYFAFRGLIGRGVGASKVRVVMFDAKAWSADFAQYDRLALITPHFSLIELIPFKNNRVIPQQALSTVTNIDDVERYIDQLGKAKNKTYLKAIDLPATERQAALRDLAVMGITAGAMFPGLDGACEELRNRNFAY